MNREENTTKPAGILRRRRSALLAGVLAVAVTGFAAGQIVPQVFSPAIAQITTDRPATQMSFADVVERVSPAVVSVRVKLDEPRVTTNRDGMERFGRENLPPQVEEFFKRFFGDRAPDFRPGPGPRRRAQGQGSGFFISADGYVVTNNHVVDKSSEVEITTNDGKTYAAKVVGTDPRTDIALLKVEGRNDFPWVKFSAGAPRVGDWVLAVGNPFGLGGTVTAGIVSARGRDIGANTYDDFIQIDAAVNRGNSGGPTFNLAGEVIGVNTAIVSPSGGNVGIAFAIPAESVNRIVQELKETGTVTRGYVGVQIQPVTKEIADSLGLKEQGGALVADVQPNTPAAKAGIKVGDAILSVDGERLKDARDLSRRVAAKQPGASVKLQVLRDGKEQTISVTLAKLPDQVQASKQPDQGKDDDTGDTRLGLTLAPAGSVAGAGSEGVVITEVDPSGPAAERGMQSGDVILEVGGKKVATPADVREAIAAARKENKANVLVRVKREDTSRFVTLPVARG
ncbi:MAG: DegQ family serine endoprotease [Bradyrhizobiaceae bacterium]|nr:DegQ family serine endoprotease [Bradyrhizobiaceae bacterium]